MQKSRTNRKPGRPKSSVLIKHPQPEKPKQASGHEPPSPQAFLLDNLEWILSRLDEPAKKSLAKSILLRIEDLIR